MNAVVAENTGRARSNARPSSNSSTAMPYDANAGWEIDRAVLARRSERRAWIVAGISISLVVLAVIAVALQGPLRHVETVAVVVDKLTGASHVETRLAAETIPPLDALDMSNAAKFVRARESYMWTFLQKDYDMVARMSTPQVFSDYSKQFAADDDLSKKFGSVGEYRVEIVNVRLPPGGRTGNKGEAIVTFDKTTRDPSTLTKSTLRYVATVRFEYRPKMLSKEVDRIENPFGFVATAYRADQELVPAAKTPS